MTRFKTALRATTIVLGIVVIGLLGWRIGLMQRGPAAPASAVADYGTVADFSLTDQNNRPFGLADLKGKVWVADFIFTSCMGPCPLITSRLSALHNEMKERKDLRFVSFSVDPDHDTPAALAAYAKTYAADPERWHFLTGPKQTIFDLIRGSFHLAVESVPGQTPSSTDVMHSLMFVLVDRNGKVIGYFNSDEPESLKQLREKISAL